MERALTRTARRPHPHRPGLLARLHLHLAHLHERHRLRDLPDHILDDIGVDRASADREAARPVWDVPKGWRR